jgi:hypothetical protein
MRVYAEVAETNDDWQVLFHKLLDESAYVVLFTGVTGSITWEIDQVFRHDPFIPTILLLPFFRASSRSKRNREAMRNFRSAFGEVTGVFLRNLDFCPVIYFPERDKPMPFGKREGFVSLGYVNEYHPAIATMLQSIDPTLAASYRSEVHWLWIALAIGIIFDILFLLNKLGG